MKKYSRNIVIVGFNENEKAKLYFKDVRTDKDNWQKNDFSHRFPYVIFVDTLEEGLKHQGFMLIFKKDFEETNFCDYDRRHRHLFKRYQKVIILDDRINRGMSSNYLNKIIVVGNYTMFYDIDDRVLKKEYALMIKNDEMISKMTKKRRDNVERLNVYMKMKREATKEDIMNYFKVSHKWVERYVSDLFMIHQNIGYDAYKKKYYYTK